MRSRSSRSDTFSADEVLTALGRARKLFARFARDPESPEGGNARRILTGLMEKFGFDQSDVDDDVDPRKVSPSLRLEGISMGSDDRFAILTALAMRHKSRALRVHEPGSWIHDSGRWTGVLVWEDDPRLGEESLIILERILRSLLVDMERSCIDILKRIRFHDRHNDVPEQRAERLRVHRNLFARSFCLGVAFSLQQRILDGPDLVANLRGGDKEKKPSSVPVAGGSQAVMAIVNGDSDPGSAVAMVLADIKADGAAQDRKSSARTRRFDDIPTTEEVELPTPSGLRLDHRAYRIGKAAGMQIPIPGTVKITTVKPRTSVREASS